MWILVTTSFFTTWEIGQNPFVHHKTENLKMLYRSILHYCHQYEQILFVSRLKAQSFLIFDSILSMIVLQMHVN